MNSRIAIKLLSVKAINKKGRIPRPRVRRTQVFFFFFLARWRWGGWSKSRLVLYKMHPHCKMHQTGIDDVSFSLVVLRQNVVEAFQRHQLDLDVFACDHLTNQPTKRLDKFVCLVVCLLVISIGLRIVGGEEGFFFYTFMLVSFAHVHAPTLWRLTWFLARHGDGVGIVQANGNIDHDHFSLAHAGIILWETEQETASRWERWGHCNWILVHGERTDDNHVADMTNRGRAAMGRLAVASFFEESGDAGPRNNERGGGNGWAAKKKVGRKTGRTDSRKAAFSTLSSLSTNPAGNSTTILLTGGRNWCTRMISGGRWGRSTLAKMATAVAHTDAINLLPLYGAWREGPTVWLASAGRLSAGRLTIGSVRGREDEMGRVWVRVEIDIHFPLALPAGLIDPIDGPKAEPFRLRSLQRLWSTHHRRAEPIRWDERAGDVIQLIRWDERAVDVIQDQ